MDGEPPARVLARMAAEGGPRLWASTPMAAQLREALTAAGALAEDGIDGDAAAELLGVEGGSAGLLAVLADATVNRDLIATRRARARVRAENPDLATRSAVRRQARDLTASEARSRALHAQMRALSALAAGEGRRADAAEAKADAAAADRQNRRDAFDGVLPFDMLRARAERDVAALPFQELKPAAFLAAARREAGTVATKARAGKHAEAAAATGRQILANEKARVAKNLREQMERDRRYLLSRLDGEPFATLGRAGATYQSQVQGIVADVSLQRISGAAIRRRAALADWIARQAAAGVAINVPPDVLAAAQRRPWQTMTADEFHRLRELVERIYHAAKTKDSVRVRGEIMRTDRLAADAEASVLASRTGDRSRRQTPLGEDVSKVAETGVQSARIARFIREMDRDRDGGPLQVALERPLTAAAVDEKDRQRAMRRRLDAAFARYDWRERMGWYFHRKDIPGAPGLRMADEQRLAVLLNLGNDGNTQRLLNEFSPDQLAAIAATATTRDAEFVQDIWDIIDSYWPEIREQALRIDGVAPPKVEATLNEWTQGIAARTGVPLRGGYYPIVHDGILARLQDAAERAAMMERGYWTSAQTRHGWLNARAESTPHKLALSLNVPFMHLAGVLHDLTHREALIATNRILRHQGLRDAIEKRYGPAVMAEFLARQTTIAGGLPGVNARGEAILMRWRNNQVLAQLAFAPGTMALQLTGAFNVAARYGWPAMMATTARLWANPRAFYRATARARSESGLMRTRITAAFIEAAEASSISDVRAPKAARYVEQAGMAGIAVVQWAADLVTYETARAAALDAGKSPADAIAIAEQAVLDLQGGGFLKDVSRQQTTQMGRFLGAFITYANLRQNLGGEAIGRFRQAPSRVTATPRLALDMLAIWVVPIVLSVWGMAKLRGDDEDDPEATWYKLLGQGVQQFFEGILLTRMVSSGAGAVARRLAGDEDARIWGVDVPGLRTPDAMLRLAGSLTDKDPGDTDWIRPAVEVLGGLTGAPTRAMRDSIEGSYRLLTEDDVPWTAPIFGPPRDSGPRRREYRPGAKR